MISIIIPFRDKVELLETCLASIFDKTKIDFEIILVDNGSQENKTKKYLDEIRGREFVKIIDYKKPFSFSAINNLVVKYASGEFVLFLNNDTEVLTKKWLEKMAKQFEDPSVGAVGVKLLYPNGTIQHAGVKVGKNIATHQFLRMKEGDLGENNIIREVDAVTGACMMTRKDIFLEMGGFDEKNLAIAYNDVDYCLRLRERGLKTIWTPEVKLFHYESASRKSDNSIFTKIFKRKRYEQFQKEQEYMKKRWIEVV